MLMKRIKNVVALSALAGIVAVQGCANMTGSADNYTAAQAQREATIRLGTVQSVRAVNIAANDPGLLGTLGGGAIGAVAGSAIGGGRGSLLTGIVGGLAGAVAGSAVEKGVTNTKGVEITVRLDSGELRAITQNAKGEVFQPGDRVRLLTSDGVTRVTR